MAKAHFLSEEEALTLRRLVADYRAATGPFNNPSRPEDGLRKEDYPSQDVYVARTPSGGIPALTEAAGASVEDSPGAADCAIYSVKQSGGGLSSQLIAYPYFQKRVFNLSGSAIAGNSWVLVVREKGGGWFAVPTAVSSGGGGATLTGVKVTRSTNQSVADSTATDVSWNGEIYDDANYITGTSTTLTLPIAARYLICVNILFVPVSGNGAGSRRTILLAGTNVLSYQVGPANTNVGGTTGTVHSLSVVYSATNTTDLIKVEVYHTHGSNINLFGATGGVNCTEMSITRLN